MEIFWLMYAERMPRSSIVLMSAGGAALLGALVVLWQSTQSDAEVAEPTTARAPSSAHEAAPVPSPPPSAPAARTGKIGSGSVYMPVRPSRNTAGPAPTLAPEPEVAAPDDPMSNTDNLHYGGTQLRAQHAAVEPLVRDCIAKAVAAGDKPTGTAILTYVVAKHGDKYEIEDTSYDSDGTTLESPSLLECLHQTAKAMKFVGLPRRSHALVVTRRVKVEAGVLTEYKHVTFSYLR